ncbi:MAG TPA: ABC transporter ATP-binding protein [Kiritimatiellia bacterium]|nr:ABC transporter ATP-binding protein [Kiritimatiellia bacterium]
MPDSLLEIESLRVVFKSGRDGVEAVSNVSLSVKSGEAVALVGESGSGKSVTALSIARLLPLDSIKTLDGSIRFEGQELLSQPDVCLRKIRGSRIAYVFQEPGAALNPVFTIGYQITEALKLHDRGAGNRRQKVSELLVSVGIADTARVSAAYPHQLSGGQQQRVMLAIALACEPALLIADEPTTALDVTVQSQILSLLKKIQKERGMSVILITHNLAIASGFARRMAVMYAGQIVETGTSEDLIKTPRHPYTRALLHAVPRLKGGARLEGIPGQVPSSGQWAAGCRFHDRCAMARDNCRVQTPELVRVDGTEGTSFSRCLFWREVSGS